MQIKSVFIDGFRSLNKLSINKIQDVNVFHGFNNSGKSNILAFLEIIFKRKLQRQEVTYNAPSGKIEQGFENRPVTFMRGKIANFRYNFFKSKIDTITFKISLSFIAAELQPDVNSYPEFFRKYIKLGTDENKMDLEGVIKEAPQDEADFFITNVKLNDVTLFDYNVSDSKVEYIPKLEKPEGADKAGAVEKFMNQFNDAVKIISSRRFITDEVEAKSTDKIEDVIMSAENFKNWLFKISLDRDKYPTFQKIKKWFNSPPFEYGEISFARLDGNLEVMVNKNSHILPIGRLGSGAQQLLILLSQIADCCSNIIGIEELEINLSPSMQSQLLNNLKAFIKNHETPIQQLFITSHSERYYDVAAINKYFVTIKDDITAIADWTADAKKALTDAPGLWATD